MFNLIFIQAAIAFGFFLLVVTIGVLFVSIIFSLVFRKIYPKEKNKFIYKNIFWITFGILMTIGFLLLLKWNPIFM